MVVVIPTKWNAPLMSSPGICHGQACADGAGGERAPSPRRRSASRRVPCRWAGACVPPPHPIRPRPPLRLSSRPRPLPRRALGGTRVKQNYMIVGSVKHFFLLFFLYELNNNKITANNKMYKHTLTHYNRNNTQYILTK